MKYRNIIVIESDNVQALHAATDSATRDAAEQIGDSTVNLFRVTSYADLSDEFTVGNLLELDLYERSQAALDEDTGESI